MRPFAGDLVGLLLGFFAEERGRLLVVSEGERHKSLKAGCCAMGRSPSPVTRMSSGVSLPDTTNARMTLTP